MAPTSAILQGTGGTPTSSHVRDMPVLQVWGQDIAPVPFPHHHTSRLIKTCRASYPFWLCLPLCFRKAWLTPSRVRREKAHFIQRYNSQLTRVDGL